MAQTLAIQGRLPGMNELIAKSKGRGGFYNYNALKKKYETMIALCIKKCGLKPMGLDVYFTFYFYELNKKRNKDNIAGGGRKLIFDALVETKIIKNDGWDEINGWEDVFFVDKKNPRIEVVMIECKI